MKNKQNRFRERMAETFADSKDILLDTSILRITGNCEVIIENYKGLVEFTDKLICVRANPENVTVSGDKLELINISDSILCIRGRISDVCLGQRRAEV